MHKAYSKVGLSHLFGEPLDLLLLVTKYYGLRDGQRIIKIEKRLAFILLFFDVYEELLDTVESKFVSFDQDLQGFAHELVGHLEDFLRKSSRDNYTLHPVWEVSVNVINLVFESLVEHFICLVQNKHLYVLGFECPSLDHVEHSSWSATHNVHAVLQLENVVINISATDATVDFDAHVISQREHNLLRLFRQLASRRQAQNLGLTKIQIDKLKSTQ